MGFFTDRKIAREQRRTARRTRRAQAGAGSFRGASKERQKQLIQQMADPNFGLADEAAIRQDQDAAGIAAFNALQGSQAGTPMAATQPGVQAAMMKTGAQAGGAAAAMAAPTARALQDQIAADRANAVMSEFYQERNRNDARIARFMDKLDMSGKSAAESAIDTEDAESLVG